MSLTCQVCEQFRGLSNETGAFSPFEGGLTSTSTSTSTLSEPGAVPSTGAPSDAPPNAAAADAALADPAPADAAPGAAPGAGPDATLSLGPGLVRSAAAGVPATDSVAGMLPGGDAVGGEGVGTGGSSGASGGGLLTATLAQAVAVPQGLPTSLSAPQPLPRGVNTAKFMFSGGVERDVELPSSSTICALGTSDKRVAWLPPMRHEVEDGYGEAEGSSGGHGQQGAGYGY